MAKATALIGVDWGTSTLRAYLIGSDGAVLESRSADLGILRIPEQRFKAALFDIVQDWRRLDMPLILSGMIGSRQGWQETGYVPAPAGLDELAAAMTCLEEDPLVHFVPGMSCEAQNGVPDVMRGEETQVLGVADRLAGRHRLVLPGTHSKWITVEEGRIQQFSTYMTGELFEVLSTHSILGRLMTAKGCRDAGAGVAFRRGLDTSFDANGALLRDLFSARTLGLFDILPANQLGSYLSGLLIGAEIKAATRGDTDLSITVIGSPALVSSYLEAIAHAGLSGRASPEHAAARGHYLLACAAGLLSSDDKKAENLP